MKIEVPVELQKVIRDHGLTLTQRKKPGNKLEKNTILKIHLRCGMQIKRDKLNSKKGQSPTRKKVAHSQVPT